jgi:hypothetical protein
MTYTIEWRRYGAIKQFTGTVSFEDVIKSERDIAAYKNYTQLWYVVSDFTNVQHPGLTEGERHQVRALRLGGFWSNPRIKVAFATDNLNVKNAIEKSVIEGQTLHATKVFNTMVDAMNWAMVL